MTLERQVDVEPRMFGPQLEAQVKEKVRREVRPATGARVRSRAVAARLSGRIM